MADAHDPTDTVKRMFGAFRARDLRATGASYRNEWSQKQVVKDGLIIEMSEYNIQVEP